MFEQEKSGRMQTSPTRAESSKRQEEHMGDIEPEGHTDV